MAGSQIVLFELMVDGLLFFLELADVLDGTLQDCALVLVAVWYKAGDLVDAFVDGFTAASLNCEESVFSGMLEGRVVRTFFVVVLANLVPLWRSNGGLLVHALGLTRSVDRSGSRVVVVSTGHRALSHVITKIQALGQVVRIEWCIRWRWVLVLRVGCKRSFGVRGEGVIVRHAILGANMLEDLLVDVQFRSSVGKAVLVVAERVPKVGLVVSGHAAVAAVG